VGSPSRQFRRQCQVWGAVIDLPDEGKPLIYVVASAQLEAGARHHRRGGPVRYTLHTDAVYSLKHLRALGIDKRVKISCDKRAKAEAPMATELGLDAVHAEVAPEEKAEIIKAL
jgi:manganese/zinc-transporting P-type ATPase C